MLYKYQCIRQYGCQYQSKPSIEKRTPALYHFNSGKYQYEYVIVLFSCLVSKFFAKYWFYWIEFNITIIYSVYYVHKVVIYYFCFVGAKSKGSKTPALDKKASPAKDAKATKGKDVCNCIYSDFYHNQLCMVHSLCIVHSSSFVF